VSCQDCNNLDNADVLLSFFSRSTVGGDGDNNAIIFIVIITASSTSNNKDNIVIIINFRGGEHYGTFAVATSSRAR
jgi:hypothetical protein